VRHHRTFLAGLAFTLIRLAACGFHGAPSLPAAAAHAHASGSIEVIVLLR
jgi:predicted small lipoprotein YifL